jgi:hypothetical protein
MPARAITAVTILLIERTDQLLAGPRSHTGPLVTLGLLWWSAWWASHSRHTARSGRLSGTLRRRSPLPWRITSPPVRQGWLFTTAQREAWRLRPSTGARTCGVSRSRRSAGRALRLSRRTLAIDSTSGSNFMLFSPRDRTLTWPMCGRVACGDRLRSTRPAGGQRDLPSARRCSVARRTPMHPTAARLVRRGGGCRAERTGGSLRLPLRGVAAIDLAGAVGRV